MKKNITKTILLAFFLGLTFGVILNIIQPFLGFLYEFIVELMDFGGKVFLTILKMLVVPIVFISVICGIGSIGNISSLGRIGIKAIFIYLFTTSIAISLSILVASFIQPGLDESIVNAKNDVLISEKPSLKDVLINIVPTNPFKSLSEGNMLQIIFLSIIFGSAISLSQKKGKLIKDFFDSLNFVVLKSLEILMIIAPIGIFCLIAKTFSTQGLEVILELGKYFFTVVTCLLLHVFLIYGSCVIYFAKISPLNFLRKIKDALIFSFSTSSSSATIPVTLKCVTKNLNVKDKIASFTVPLGSTLNMDGTAIMQGVATIFIANIYGFDLSLSDFMSIILTATLASIGTAGVPGVGLVMLGMVLNQVGLPLEGIALIIGVDRILDMMRTATNVSGDIAVSLFINHTEK